jgi:hypothetical protein
MRDPDSGPSMSAYELYVLGLARVAEQWERLGPLLADAGRLVADARIGADLGFPETAGQVQVYDAMRQDLASALDVVGRRYVAEGSLLRMLDDAYTRAQQVATNGYAALGPRGGRPVPF